MRTHEDVHRALEYRMDNYKTELDAWKKVTFNFKKDGTPFQHLKQCFNNATYGFSPYDNNHSRPRLTACYQTAHSGYQSSEIFCTKRDGSFFTFEEIKEAISQKIEFIELAIEGCEYDMEIVDEQLSTVDAEVDKIKQIIQKCKECSHYLNDYVSDKVRFIYMPARH